MTGICLWAGNEATAKKYDYPVFTEDLPLTRATIELGLSLVNRFTAFSEANWQWPNPDQESNFRDDANLFLKALCEELPTTFTVLDESGWVANGTQ